MNINWNKVKGTKTIVFNSVEMRTTQCIGNVLEIILVMFWSGLGRGGSNLSKINPDKLINSACNRPKNVILSKVVANCNFISNISKASFQNSFPMAINVNTSSY